MVALTCSVMLKGQQTPQPVSGDVPLAFPASDSPAQYRVGGQADN